MGTKTNIRNQGLDLLRVICMLMVVCLHYLGQGGLVEGALTFLSPNWFLGQLIAGFCRVCVNCFILISGYFMCTSKFRLGKWVSIWIQTMFYSVAIYLILVIFGIIPFTVSELVKSFLVFTLSRYWFVTSYLLLLIVSPFLNYAIAYMDQRAHATCCFVMFLIFSVLHNVVYICDFAWMNGGSGLIGFCVMYVFAAYIRKYVSVYTAKTKRALINYVICMLITVGERVLAYGVTPYIFGTPILTSLFYPYNSITNIVGSIALFLVFLNISTLSKPLTRVIQFVAPVSFAVYLIHMHPSLQVPLWEILTPYAYAHSPWMLTHMVICVGGIFIASCAIEHLRRWAFRTTGLDKGINTLCIRITKRLGIELDKWLEKSETQRSTGDCSACESERGSAYDK